MAALAPSYKRRISRQKEPLTSPGYVPLVSTTDLAAKPYLTQVPVIHADDHVGLKPSANPVSRPWTRSSISDVTYRAKIAPVPSPGARHRSWLSQFPATRFWLFFLLSLTMVPTGSGNEYDATGREVSFYPNPMMLATNPKAMVFFRDTKLVSVHLNVPHVQKGDSTHPLVHGLPLLATRWSCLPY